MRVLIPDPATLPDMPPTLLDDLRTMWGGIEVYDLPEAEVPRLGLDLGPGKRWVPLDRCNLSLAAERARSEVDKTPVAARTEKWTIRPISF